MEWYLPEEKAKKVIRRCLDGCNATHMDLKQTQELMGSVNDVAQMCPIMKMHKGSGNLFLAAFRGRENILLPVPKDMKEDLSIIAKISERAKRGLPIAAEPCKAPLSALVFYSDAAGASFTMVNGERILHSQKNRGVACIGGETVENMWIWSKVDWPEKLLTETKDEKGVFYGYKSTTLESIGILIPFLGFPDVIKGRHLIFKVDNIAVSYGWQNGYVKKDKSATRVLKSVRYLAAFLGVTVHVEHVDRVSDSMSYLVDELSRTKEPKDIEVREALGRAEKREIRSYLNEWLENPEEEDLCRKLVEELKKKGI